MSPRNRDLQSEPDRHAQLYAAASLLVALGGAFVLALGFAVYPPIQPLGLGLAGLAVGVGATHLWRALSRRDGVRARSPREAADDRPTGTEEDPVEILKRRYARGDVADDEFERRMGRLVELDSGEESDGARRDEALVER